MTALIDARPPGIDAFFKPGNTFTLTLTWPALSLVGRTFVAALDLAALSVGITGDVMTITATEAQTLAATSLGAFTLTETTGGKTEILIVGRWEPSDGPSATSSSAVTVQTGPASVAVTVGTTDSLYHQPNLVRPPGSLATWRAALAQASSRLVVVAIPGDSISNGEMTTDSYGKAFPGLLRTALQAKYGDGGSGFINHGFRNAQGSVITTTTGAWSDTDNEGGLSRRSLRPTTPGNGATVTTPVRGTIVDLYYRTDPTFGTWHYQIDGGAFIAVPLNTAASMKKVTVTGLANTTHTVTSRCTSGTGGDGRWYGHRGRNTTGVCVDVISTQGTMWMDYRTQTAGVTGAGGDPATNTMIYRSLEALAPIDLVLYTMGINDVLVDVVDTTWQSDMWDAFALANVAATTFGPNATTPADAVVMIPNVGDGDIIPGFSNWERDWPQLWSMLNDFGTSIGAPVIDMWGVGHRKWAYWQSLTAWGNNNIDPVHPNDLGHTFISQMLNPLLVNP